jgi:hypothetical protein
MTVAATAWGNAVTAPFWVSSDSSSLLLGGWFNQNNSMIAGGLTVLERTRNWDGTANNEGFLAFWQSGQSTAGTPIAPTRRNLTFANSAVFAQPGSVGFGTGVWADPVTPSNTMIVGSNTYLGPMFTGWTPYMQGPSRYLVWHFQNDVPVTTQFVASHYGASHTFSSLGSVGSFWAPQMGTSSATNTSGAFRID